MKNPLKPSTSLLVKLGSIAAHVDEMLSPKRHAFDQIALQSLIDDVEVMDWLEQMGKMALLPVKR